MPIAHPPGRGGHGSGQDCLAGGREGWHVGGEASETTVATHQLLSKRASEYPSIPGDASGSSRRETQQERGVLGGGS